VLVPKVYTIKLIVLKIFGVILPVLVNDEVRYGMVVEDTLAVLRVVAVAWLLVNWIWLAMLVGNPVSIC
jgi:hypothetical protein